MFYADGQRFAAQQLGLDKEAKLRDLLGIGKNTLQGLLPALTREEKVRRAASKALAEAPLPAQDAARMRAAAQRAETGRLPEGWSMAHDAVSPRHITELPAPKTTSMPFTARRLKAAGVIPCSTKEASTPPFDSSAFSKLARLQCRHSSLNSPSSLHRLRPLLQLKEAQPSWAVGQDKPQYSSEKVSSACKVAKAHRLSRRMTFRGLNISIETDKDELRHWYDPHNKTKGSTKMTHAYGYIRRTKGVDGDHVDVYVGPNEQAKNVYVVHQMKAPDFKKYDEDKCMLGFDSADAAKKAYLANFDDARFFGSMTTMPFEEFKKKALATFEGPKKIAGLLRNLGTRLRAAKATHSGYQMNQPVTFGGATGAMAGAALGGLVVPGVGAPLGALIGLPVGAAVGKTVGTAGRSVRSLGAALGRPKIAANPLLGRTTSAVRRAVQAGNVHRAHEIARLGIRTGTVEPPMLQRYMTAGAGITPHEAELWRIASRSARG